MKQTYKDIIPVDGGSVIIDKKSSYRNGDYITDGTNVWEYILSTTQSCTPNPNYKVIASIGRRIKKDIPLIELPESFELKVIKTVKEALVKGQQFDLAANFRDQEKCLQERQWKNIPTSVTLEHEIGEYYSYVSESGGSSETESGGFKLGKLKITDPKRNTITPIEVTYE